jgi:hypothetical protein
MGQQRLSMAARRRELVVLARATAEVTGPGRAGLHDRNSARSWCDAVLWPLFPYSAGDRNLISGPPNCGQFAINGTGGLAIHNHSQPPLSRSAPPKNCAPPSPPPSSNCARAGRMVANNWAGRIMVNWSEPSLPTNGMRMAGLPRSEEDRPFRGEVHVNAQAPDSIVTAGD